MTAAGSPRIGPLPAGPPPGRESRPVTSTVRRPRRPRRWIRAAVPFAVLLPLWALTGIAHAVEEPDLTDPATLAPSGTGADGSSRLAAMLTARGVRIDRVATSQQAITAAAAADATVFVPAPDFISPSFAALVAGVAGRHRVVVVEPGRRTTAFWRVPILAVAQRWATRTVAPACSAPYAAAAGAAAVLRTRYLGGGAVDCYSGGLLGVEILDAEIIVVGASDPFRNSRIAEHGNAALATALLGEHGRVVWVDVHRREPVSLSPVNLPGLPDYNRPDRDRPGGPADPLWNALPAGLWTTLAMALAVGLLMAAASARRLGPPIAEPLPVLVPSAETVTGRGRLYERVRARAASLDALRAAAIIRLHRALHPFGGAAAERQLTGPDAADTAAAQELIERIAARTGMPVTAIRATLYEPAPDDDEGLHRAVGELDAVVHAVLQDNRRGQP